MSDGPSPRSAARPGERRRARRRGPAGARPPRATAEGEQRESQRLFRALAENSPVGIFRTDTGGRTTYVNPRWCEIAGIPAERALGDGWLDAVDPDDRERLASGWTAASTAGGVSSAEYRFRRPDGTIVWVAGHAVPELDEAGGVAGYVGTVSDVTEVRQAQRALAANELRLRLALDAAALGSWDWDLDSGRVVWAGRHAALLGLGDGGDAATYDAFLRCVHPDDRAGLERAVGRALEGDGAYAHEYRVVWPDASVHWIAGNGRVLFDAGRRPTRMLGVIRDVSEGKRTEERLAHQAARLETSQRVAGMGFLDWDLRTGRVYVSQQVRRIFGLDPDVEFTTPELVARSVHPDDVDAVRQGLEQGARGERPYDLEHRIVRPDGAVVWLHAQGELIRDAQGNPATLLGTVVDITEHKREQQALRESEAKYRHIFERAPAGIYQSSLGGRLLSANPALARMFGYGSPEELVGAAVDLAGRLFVHPEARAEFVRQALGAPGFVQRVVEYRRKDGSVLVANVHMRAVRSASGEPEFLEGFAEDVTERTRAEEQTRRQAERLDAQVKMLESLHVSARLLAGTLDVSTVTEYIAWTCVETFGARLVWVGRAEADGSVTVVAQFPPGHDYPHRIAVRWDDSPLAQGPTGQAIRLGTPVVFADLAAEREFAPWREAALAEGLRTSAAFPLLGPSHPFGAFTVYSDQPGFFTEERSYLFQTFAHQAAAALENARLFGEIQGEAARLERRVAQRTAELEETNRELDAFAYSVSHDLRAPLRAMFGLSQALLEDYAERLDETGKDYATRVVAAAKRLDEMIQDLLAYSRLTRSELVLQPVDLGHVVHDALLTLREAVAKAEVAVDEAMPVVLANRPTLLQVLTNLIGNAVKFVAPGVRPAIQVSAAPAGSMVRVSVRDNGIGIAPEHLERIFHVFERLHGAETYPGTGIGLAIVRKGIERMGGRVGVESQVGTGSRFWFELPPAREAR